MIGSPYCVRRYAVDAILRWRRGPGQRQGGSGGQRRAAPTRLCAQSCGPRSSLDARHTRRGSFEASRAIWSQIRRLDQDWRRGPGSRTGPLLPALARRGPAGRLFRRATRRHRRHSRRPSPTSATASGATWPCCMTNDVFSRTWAGRSGPAPAEDFWPAVIARFTRPASRDRAPRRDLLGHGMGSAAARIRLLLRQTAL